VDKPVTTPLLLTSALVLLALHVPLPAASVRVVVEPMHKLVEPDTVPALTVADIVIGKVTIDVPHALVTVYEMIEVPSATPVTNPDDDETEALVLLLVHTPPVVASVNSDGEPTQRTEDPTMAAAAGIGFTVMG
jgi:hypothetical protein